MKRTPSPQPLTVIYIKDNFEYSTMGSFWVCNICGWDGSHFKRDTFGAGLLLVIVDLRGEDFSVEMQLDVVIAKGHLTNQGNSINVRCEKVDIFMAWGGICIVRRSLTYLWCSLLKRIILPGSCIDLSEVQSNQARISEYLRQKWRRTSNSTGHWIYWALWCFLLLSAPLLPGGIWSSDIRTPWHSLGVPTTAPPWSSRGHRSQSDPRGWPNVEQCTMVFHGFPWFSHKCLLLST